MGAPESEVRMVEAMHENTKARVVVGSGGDCSLVRRFWFYSPKVRKSEIKGSSLRRFVSTKVRKSDKDIDSFLL